MRLSEIVPIEQLVSLLPYDLVDKGDYYSLRCPYHDDKDPSSAIYKKNAMFICFSCGVTITVENMVNQVSGKDALAHFNIPDILDKMYTSSVKAKPNDPYNKEIVINEGSLVPAWSVEQAREYLLNRHWNEEMAKYYNVKWANFCRINSLVYKNRVVFPIYHKGKLINYEGRQAVKSSIDKRKVIYAKHSTTQSLFNYDRLNREDTLIVCEGTMHIGHIFRYITHNVTHTLGARVTKTQYEFINEFKKVVFFIDNDVAGHERVSDHDKNLNMEFELCWMPKGDPGEVYYTKDDVIREYNNRISITQYMMDKYSIIPKQEIIWEI